MGFMGEKIREIYAKIEKISKKKIYLYLKSYRSFVCLDKNAIFVLQYQQTFNFMLV